MMGSKGVPEASILVRDKGRLIIGEQVNGKLLVTANVHEDF